ncbi:MAG TPA: MBL fold metallo-hydrolase [Acidimicrobiales bacterium]|nr:MBL fold metallo-hydrolase [Acidimicrobiales bacterium]
MDVGMTEGFRLTVLGCDGSYPGPAGACSGYLVRAAGKTVWLDAGSGTLANLQRHVGLHELDAIVLSHEHPDHWSDLDGYRVAAAYVLKRTGVPVYAPAGVQARVFSDFEPAVTWHTVTDGDEILLRGGADGDVRLRFSRTDHGPETLAVRIDSGGRSLAYSADTGPGWSLSALGEGIDLALCEATWLVDREGNGGGGHLSARQAGAMARAAGAARLVITHVWPIVDPEEARAEAAAAYGGPVEVARLHAEYSV